MVGNPPILLLDEPSSNLDPTSREAFRQLLSRHAGTVLLVTHDPVEMALADQVWELTSGRLTKVETRRAVPRPALARVPAHRPLVACRCRHDRPTTRTHTGSAHLHGVRTFLPERAERRPADRDPRTVAASR